MVAQPSVAESAVEGALNRVVQERLEAELRATRLRAELGVEELKLFILRACQLARRLQSDQPQPTQEA